MKKAAEISLIILFNIALLFSAIAIPALSLSTSKDFYRWGLEKTGVYSTISEDGKTHKFKVDFIGGDEDTAAIFEDYQIDIISEHIINFMAGENESFLLVLDDVYIVGEGRCDGVAIFGEDAIRHMEDVRGLVEAAKILSVISVLILISGIITYLIFIKRLSLSPNKISLIFYSAILSLCALFLLWSYIGRGQKPFLLSLWQNLHYILFPFQTGKVEGSVLRDALSVILSTEFFIGAVVIILSIAIFTVALWLVLSFIYERKMRERNLYF